LVACIAFIATLLQSLSTWSFSTHPMKSQVALLVSLVNGVSATLYLAKCLGHVTIVASGAPGEHMMPLRYLQWLFTTGCLIRTLACLSPDGPGAARALRRTLRWDALMLASGCAERLLPSPVNGVAFVASTLGFLQTMRGQYALFAMGEKTLSTQGDLVALKALRRVTTLTWCAFPLARAACWGGVLGTNGEECVFSVLDVLAKFGYSTFLMVGTFALAAKGAE
jgi:bacteriorhodopsin